ncbi:PadR family transcriptional regulator [Asanoa siamensis]|uniref:PadR family transcriptional regulator n=1 Tax=Asanoa siamensis TaxID=926357 RepID=A0ABQ4CQS7_9ACTN|nr:PadR family transcriptional regulator [Asanoa siamensis]GIF73602.1 PadR family transcriptional regulator [Asanoa siamensis]
MSLKHAILGLLDLRPRTGYDLKKAFDDTARHFWAADRSQIYRTLAGLHADGLLEERVIAQRSRPDRHEYRLTDDGRAELQRWLRSPAPVEPSREAFLARIFFAGQADDPEVVRTLAGERRALAHERLDELRALTAHTDTFAGRLRALTLRAGILHLETELRWLDEVEAAL